MVVRQYGLPVGRWNLRAYGFSIQYLCFSRALEGIHTTRCSRAKWSSNTGPKMVRPFTLPVSTTYFSTNTERLIYIMIPRLIGINAAQLALALISNLFLLLNMARRVRFIIAQPITIIGW